MTSAPTINAATQATGEPDALAVSWPARCAVLAVALELMSFCILIGIYAVFRASHPEVSRAGLMWFGWGWGVAQLAVVALGGLTAWIVLPRLRAAGRAAAMTLSAIVVMYGLAALGLKGVEWSRWGGPHIITIPPAAASVPTAGPKALEQKKADPAAGGKLFAMTCAACHGAAGEGIPNVAPALKNADFTRQSTEAQITTVIANGRAANDPATKTGKVMPARGGNPFLSDVDIANIVAFLRSGDAAAGASTPSATKALRWVVPAPPAGPQGLAEAGRVGLIPPVEHGGMNPALQQPSSAERAFAPVAAALSALHGLHLLVGIAVMVALVWLSYAGPGDRGLVPARFARIYWLAAVIMWLVMFPLLYVI